MANVSISVGTPYPWQREILDSKKQNILLVCSRQIGKTWLARQLALREALHGGRVLWAAPNYKQVVKNYESLLDTLKPVTTKALHCDTLRLATKGLIDFRSTSEVDNLRGDNYTLLILDEAAYMSDKVLAALQPMLIHATGRLVLISTPNGFNWFQSMFSKAKASDNWEVRQLSWRACPDITPEKLEEFSEGMSEGKKRQEYEAVFTQGETSIFRAEWLVDETWDGTNKHAIWVDEIPQGVQRHAISVDLSLGRQASDWQGLVYVAVKDGVMYCECYADKMPVPDLLEKTKALYELKHPEGVAIETVAFQSLAADFFQRMFVVPINIWRLDNKVPKETRISRLQGPLKEGTLKLVRNPGGLEAYREFADYPSKEQHDDVIDAIEQGWRALASGK